MAIDKQALLELINTHVSTGRNEIRFGDPTRPRGVMDALVIRRQQTVGGVQFSIRQVSMRGEGSGMYEMEPSKIVDWAERLVDDYTKPHPNPMIHELVTRSKPTALSFYVVPV